MRTVRCSCRRGGCLSMGGVCPGAVGLGEGGCDQGCLTGVSARGGGPGVSASVHAGIHPPWTEFLTYACENITFPQPRCGR